MDLLILSLQFCSLGLEEFLHLVKLRQLEAHFLQLQRITRSRTKKRPRCCAMLHTYLAMAPLA